MASVRHNRISTRWRRRHIHHKAASSSPDEPQKEERPPKPNLCRLLLKQLEDKFLAIGRRADKSRTDRSEHQEDANQLVEAEYRPRSFLRRRAPDEIETAVTQLDQGALTMAKKSFTSNLDLTEFAEAIVSTGTYDADRVLAFVSGVVDLYLEVFRSQGERASERAVNWAQLMNHFIESPEIVMFEGNEVSSAGPKSVSGAENLAQVRRSNVVDCAKHMGSVIHKINWMASLEMLTSVEGTESVYFWSPFMAWETARVVTPQLPADFYDERQKPLWTVHAVAWDNDSQDLAALLSNRFLVFWRLRNRDKGQFQQKKEFRFHATRSQGRNSSTHEISQWEVHLRTLDPKNGDLLRDPPSGKEPSEAGARRDKREERFAAEASQQLDIWWSASMKVWVTADYNGRFLLWDLREHSIATTIAPTKVLQAHSKVITTFLELSTFKFTTGSLDRSVCLWDHRNLSGPEVKLEDWHIGTVFRPSLRSFFLFCLVCSVAFSLAGVTLVTLEHREPLCTDLLDGESYDSAEGKAIDDSVHVVTWATSDSGYLRRLKASAAWQGYAPLTVLGLGTSWRGPFYSKLVPLVSFLPKLADQLVLVVDYDAFLQQGPSALKEAYRANARPGNVWISAESLCNGSPELPFEQTKAAERNSHGLSCYPFRSQRPNTHGSGQAGTNRFLNTGFTVGPADKVLRFYQAVQDAVPWWDQYASGVEQWWAGRLHATATWADLVDLDSQQRGAGVVLGTELLQNRSDTFGVSSQRKVVWGNWIWHDGLLQHPDGHAPIAVHFPNQRRAWTVLRFVELCQEHTGSIRAQAYLPLFSSLVTVGCEKRVFVWSIDSTAYRGVRAKLSAHQSNLSGVSAGQRVFVTLDEACIFILWDGATLAALQTTNCFTLGARHVVVMPSLGRICLAGRRLNFFEGNEQGSIALGAAPTKEQVAIAKRREAEGASLKDRAAPKWCGLGPSRGVLLSATEAEALRAFTSERLREHPRRLAALLGRAPRMWDPQRAQAVPSSTSEYPWVDEALRAAAGGATEFALPRQGRAAARAMRWHWTFTQMLGLPYLPQASEIRHRLEQARSAAARLGTLSVPSSRMLDMPTSDLEQMQSGQGVQEGDLLLTHPLSGLFQPVFDQSLILIVHVRRDKDWVQGVVVNKEAEETISQTLVEKPTNLLSRPDTRGTDWNALAFGPLQPLLEEKVYKGRAGSGLDENMLWLHSYEDVPGAKVLHQGLAVGGDLAATAERAKESPKGMMKIIKGFSVWGFQQLKLELERGVWVHIRGSASAVHQLVMAEGAAPWSSALAGCGLDSRLGYLAERLAEFPRSPEADTILKEEGLGLRQRSPAGLRDGVRLHSRICPSQSKALFNAPEGDTISAFCACDSQSYSVLGTAKGGIYFLKYRSGFTLRAYQRRREDIEEWPSAAGGAAASSSSAPGFTSEIVSFEGPPSPGVAGGSSMERIGSPPNSQLPSTGCVTLAEVSVELPATREHQQHGGRL
eukprot:s1163_g18.t2